MWDIEGDRYLDLLSGYSVFNLGRNHPEIEEAMHEALSLERPNLVKMDNPLLSGLLAEELVKRMPHLGVHSAEMTMEDETGALRRRGYKAIYIAGMDPATGSLPRWHRADDTVDSISGEVLEAAAEFMETLLRELDDQAALG